MRTADIIFRIAHHGDSIRAKGATALFIYGSRARDDARPDSDLDVFVDCDEQRPFSLFDLIAIKHLIEDELGISVDIATRGSLEPRLREAIERDARRVL